MIRSASYRVESHRGLQESLRNLLAHKQRLSDTQHQEEERIMAEIQL